MQFKCACLCFTDRRIYIVEAIRPALVPLPAPLFRSRKSERRKNKVEITVEGKLARSARSDVLACKQKSSLKNFDIGGKTGQGTCSVSGKGENYPTIPQRKGVRRWNCPPANVANKESGEPMRDILLKLMLAELGPA